MEQWGKILFKMKYLKKQNINKKKLNKVFSRDFLLRLLSVLGIAFSLRPHFSDLLKVFGFLVTLLYIFGKKVIFSKFFDFQQQFSSVTCEDNAAYMVWCIPNIDSMFIGQIWSNSLKLSVLAEIWYLV